MSFTDHGINYIKSESILSDGGIDESKFAYISTETHEKLKRSQIHENDLLMSMAGVYLGKTALVPKHVTPANTNQAVAIIRLTNNVIPRYVLFCTRDKSFVSYVNSSVAQSAQPNINLAEIGALKIPLPPLADQRAIAHILGTLDDKIELNRKMNETLEAMARAQFKSWFIDFDPVRKKQAGQSTGLPPEIDALFPGEFDPSTSSGSGSRSSGTEPVEVPKGWRVGKFSEFIRILSGGTPKTSVTEYWNGSIPWFSVVDSPSTSDVFVWDTEKKITQAGVDNSAASILPTGTTVVTARGTVGKTALMARPMSINQSCYGILPIDGANVYFNYFQIRTMIAELQSKTHGSVFDTITRETFETVNVILPSSDLMFAFENSLKDTMTRILNNNKQNSTLKAVRDTLLPKLISGELRAVRCDPSSGLRFGACRSVTPTSQAKSKTH